MLTTQFFKRKLGFRHRPWQQECLMMVGSINIGGELRCKVHRLIQSAAQKLLGMRY